MLPFPRLSCNSSLYSFPHPNQFLAPPAIFRVSNHLILLDQAVSSQFPSWPTHSQHWTCLVTVSFLHILCLWPSEPHSPHKLLSSLCSFCLLCLFSHVLMPHGSGLELLFPVCISSLIISSSLFVFKCQLYVDDLPPWIPGLYIFVYTFQCLALDVWLNCIHLDV